MATNFPTALDELTNPSSLDKMNSPTVPHATQHSNANDAIEALQLKVGVNGSADQDSIDYKLANGTLLLSYSKTGVLAVSDGAARLYPPRAMTLSAWEIWVSAAPTGADLVATVKKNGAVIETLTLTAGQNYASGGATTALLATDFLTTSITQVGSTVAGADLSIRLKGN